MNQNLKLWIMGIVAILIGFMVVTHIVDRINENAPTCIWCKDKILDKKPDQFDHWYLHERCYSEVSWWSRFISWYLKGTPLNESSEESRTMMKKLIEWRIEAESEVKYLVGKAIGEDCEKKMAEEWK